jgi:membrane associated rhomboid family serine protease
VVLGSWFVLQWLYSVGAGSAEGAGVAYLAHVAGFVAGVVLVIVLGGLRVRRPPPSTWDYDYYRRSR